ncbi:PWWP domain-containing protein 2A [Anabrus simplex]|uniref:PWWP domain-containing protein 2A n=1 Tax=Anabrus simplex TaxID=316456 RepID=UPI0034DD8E5E
MADLESVSQMNLLKNSKILVNVDEVLQDILVVSYICDSKLYQGALLDSTKKGLPCGISVPPLTKGDGEEDKLYSISQRFSYFQENTKKVEIPFHLRRTIRPPARYKNARMTVRLRPRQVLCSKCRSICNENSENVDLSKKRKSTEQPELAPTRSPRPLFSENQRENQVKSPPSESLIPKLANEINKIKIVGNYWVRHTSVESQGEKKGVETRSEKRVYCLSVESEKPPSVVEEDTLADSCSAGPDCEDSNERMVLRKKRSVGSMEDLWDESVFEVEDGMRKGLDRPDADKKTRGARATPVIKISFGSQGEGTVLKIPSKIQNYIPSESESEEKQRTKDASAKAAKKALKRAKKEARRKLLRRHKHKMKHKKKHKDERKHNKEEDYTAIKERCLKQKLSISLKRLNANAYYLGSNGCKSPTTSSCSNSEMSDDHGEAVPDFPSSHPLMMRISSQNVGSCLTGDGRRMAVGDVVWGKIHGFPWWPGKVLSITMSRKDDGGFLSPQAHVAWYGSSTSSLMPCDQLSPFLETFKTRYNKKKRGPYKEAIRQATCEARREEEDVILPVTASSSSPQEVNVAS